jgi:tetratricopeptide (TPR) repeat protein
VLLNQRSRIPHTIECFMQALELDPGFALAYASVAEANMVLGFYGFARAHQVMPAAKLAAQKALAIDPALADPHVVLAVIGWIYEWDWELTRREFGKAIGANPRLASAYVWQSLYLACTEGKFDEAIAAGRRASELDPLSGSAHTALAWVHCCAHNYEKAEEEARRGLAIEPFLWTAARVLGVALMAQGRYPDSIEVLEAAMPISGRHVWIATNLAEVYALSGQPDRARRLFDEIAERSRTQYVQPLFLGLLHAAIGDNDRVFEIYAKAVEERDTLPIINYSPAPGSLVRRDPRFYALVRRLGLTPAPDLVP